MDDGKMNVGPIVGDGAGAPGCKHQWGPLTRYKDYKLGTDAKLKRVDTRERMTCTECGGVDDVLVDTQHIDGLVL